jgi:hypothetical protein
MKIVVAANSTIPKAITAENYSSIKSTQNPLHV